MPLKLSTFDSFFSWKIKHQDQERLIISKGKTVNRNLLIFIMLSGLAFVVWGLLVSPESLPLVFLGFTICLSIFPIGLGFIFHEAEFNKETGVLISHMKHAFHSKTLLTSLEKIQAIEVHEADDKGWQNEELQVHLSSGKELIFDNSQVSNLQKPLDELIKDFLDLNELEI